LFFSFTDPGGRELRERQKEKEKESGGLTGAILPHAQLFLDREETGKLAAAACLCTRLLCPLKS
jgi:hypothetical protein